MSLPEIKDIAEGTVFEWEKGRVTILVSRLRSHRDGRVTGRIRIRTNASGFSPHLHESDFNFSGPQARRTLAQNLAEDYADLTNWKETLEQLCVKMLEKLQEGEPTVEILSGDDAEPPPPLLPPFLIEGQPTIIYGERGASKTNFALLLAAMLQDEGLANEFEHIGPRARPAEVLFLDYESDLKTIRFLLSRIQRGMGTPQLGIHYRRRAFPLSDDIEQVKLILERTGAGLIIIDSLGMAAGGDLNATEPALRFWAAQRTLNMTTLIMAHTAKNTEDKRKTVYGNAYYENESKVIWEIRKSQEQDSSEMDIALFHRKSAPFQGYHKPIGLHFVYQGEGMNERLVVTPGRPQTVSDFLGLLSVRTQILELLKSGPKTAENLAEMIDRKTGHISKELTKLKSGNFVIQLGAQQWGLIQQESPTYQ